MDNRCVEPARLISPPSFGADHQADRKFGKIDKLQQSIPAKVFRGELVPQDPTDEPAYALLEGIMAERAEGVASDKRKKKKPATVAAQKRSTRKPAVKTPRLFDYARGAATTQTSKAKG